MKKTPINIKINKESSNGLDYLFKPCWTFDRLTIIIATDCLLEQMYCGFHCKIKKKE